MTRSKHAKAAAMTSGRPLTSRAWRWRKLGWIENNDDSILALLHKARHRLEAGAILTGDERDALVELLHRVMSRPLVLRQVYSRGKGRAQRDRAYYMAIDYDASKRRLGKAAAAASDVAQAWRCSVKTVTDAFTDHRNQSAQRVDDFLRRVGRHEVSVIRSVRTEIVWTKANVLEAISSDLRERFCSVAVRKKVVSRKKSR
jgi:hypothetical protein